MLQIDGAALQVDLEELAQIGADPDGGISRIAYSSEWLMGRRWLRAQMEALDMSVRIDAAGNLIGTYAGSDHDLPPLATGSHTDTVRQGGLYDGSLGVLAGLACVRALSQTGERLRHPLEVIDFACEEATYGGGTLGSQAMAGQWQHRLLAEPAGQGLTLADLIAGAGIAPDLVDQARRQPGELAAFVELHIEQGGRLEAAGLSVGVVTGIVGIRRYRLTFHGQANHAGTTPMDLRRDALVVACDFVRAVQEETRLLGDPYVGTVGHLQVFPGSPNVIPGRVELTVEIRGPQDDKLEHLSARLADRAGSTHLDRVVATQPVPSNLDVVQAACKACELLGLPYMPTISGAGHDAMCLAAIAPTAMLFVRSQGGISHSPLEFTEPTDCTRGADVLLQTLLLLDRQL